MLTKRGRDLWEQDQVARVGWGWLVFRSTHEAEQNPRVTYTFRVMYLLFFFTRHTLIFALIGLNTHARYGAHINVNAGF